MSGLSFELGRYKKLIGGCHARTRRVTHGLADAFPFAEVLSVFTHAIGEIQRADPAAPCLSIFLGRFERIRALRGDAGFSFNHGRTHARDHRHGAPP
jgi:hypothetical protein